MLTTDQNTLIRIRDLHKTYVNRGVQTRALYGIDLDIAAGEFVAIMGPSGSGKSTLMHIIGLLDIPSKGSYRLRGSEVAALDGDSQAEIRNSLFGFVFQQFNLLPRTSVFDNVKLPTIYAGKRAHRDAEQVIERVGLTERMAHLSSELSGGQIQRVAIARALIMDPSVLIADEPTGNLDSHTSHEIMRLFREINAGGTTIVLVTHEEDVARYAKRMITLKDGRIISDKPSRL